MKPRHVTVRDVERGAECFGIHFVLFWEEICFEDTPLDRGTNSDRAVDFLCMTLLLHYFEIKNCFHQRHTK